VELLARNGEDPARRKIIARSSRKRLSWAKTSLLSVLDQAPLLFITCLPAQLGIWGKRWRADSDRPFGALAQHPAASALRLKRSGDALNAFRANPANKGALIIVPVALQSATQIISGDAPHLVGICPSCGVRLRVDQHHRAGIPDVHSNGRANFCSNAAEKTRPEYAAYVARTFDSFRGRLSIPDYLINQIPSPKPLKVGDLCFTSAEREAQFGKRSNSIGNAIRLHFAVQPQGNTARRRRKRNVLISLRSILELVKSAERRVNARRIAKR
jgi:hypothetical protein